MNYKYDDNTKIIKLKYKMTVSVSSPLKYYFKKSFSIIGKQIVPLSVYGRYSRSWTKPMSKQFKIVNL